MSAYCQGQSDAQVALAAAHQTASEADTASVSSLLQHGSAKLQRTSSELLSQPSSGTRSLESSGPNR